MASLSGPTAVAVRPRRLEEFIDALHGRGRDTFQRAEARSTLGIAPEGFKKAARLLARKHRLVSPRRGFCVIVPVEHRAAGAPPPPPNRKNTGPATDSGEERAVPGLSFSWTSPPAGSIKTRLAPTDLIVQASGTAAQDRTAWRAGHGRPAATLERLDINVPEEENPQRGSDSERGSAMAGRPIGEPAR